MGSNSAIEACHLLRRRALSSASRRARPSIVAEDALNRLLRALDLAQRRRSPCIAGTARATILRLIVSGTAVMPYSGRVYAALAAHQASGVFHTLAQFAFYLALALAIYLSICQLMPPRALLFCCILRTVWRGHPFFWERPLAALCSFASPTPTRFFQALESALATLSSIYGSDGARSHPLRTRHCPLRHRALSSAVPTDVRDL